MKSERFKLSKPLVSLLEQHGITDATPIQHEVIPAIFEGRDILAQSETGSGKTLSFALPIIEQTNRRDGLVALVLVPTRELCLQVAGEFMKFSAGRHLGVTSVYGGVSISDQIKKLRTTNVIVATPGRLLDLLERKAVTLETVRTLVFDEADRMLDMGFIRDIERILRHIRQEHQTLLLSATISDEITRLSHKYLRNPLRVQFASSVEPDFLRQTYHRTTPEQKLPLLIALLKKDRELALVFCNRKHYASKLAQRLSVQGVAARALHGDMSQGQRERATADFRQKKFTVLVATDVAARGLHIDGITHVYNYEIPKDVESYTHRVGRTARAGKQGEAISLVAGSDEEKFFRQILFTYRGVIELRSMKDVPPLLPGIEPDHRRKPQHSPGSPGEERGSARQRRFRGGSHKPGAKQGGPARQGKRSPSSHRGESASGSGGSERAGTPGKERNSSEWRKSWRSWKH